ncbi:phospholipase A1-II 5-like [Iris pallida]|uniref:Phospholipase A1-II 5-like n=1 Tax=Iris pallida TaxID=29817 RepID=A0AAX6EGD7_IRIPA|nr:phospholipase A1-II 5-like [Iris pallida]
MARLRLTLSSNPPRSPFHPATECSIPCRLCQSPGVLESFRWGDFRASTTSSVPMSAYPSRGLGYRGIRSILFLTCSTLRPGSPPSLSAKARLPTWGLPNTTAHTGKC